mmetsp:Transcript_19566/g.47290  ORF Transcript_19566/g.47290 Transcript_19566/m.47290 type:complete len:391 (+) Transcript_19566:455-1627(+)
MSSHVCEPSFLFVKKSPRSSCPRQRTEPRDQDAAAAWASGAEWMPARNTGHEHLLASAGQQLLLDILRHHGCTGDDTNHRLGLGASSLAIEDHRKFLKELKEAQAVCLQKGSASRSQPVPEGKCGQLPHLRSLDQLENRAQHRGDLGDLRFGDLTTLDLLDVLTPAVDGDNLRLDLGALQVRDSVVHNHALQCCHHIAHSNSPGLEQCDVLLRDTVANRRQAHGSAALQSQVLQNSSLSIFDGNGQLIINLQIIHLVRPDHSRGLSVGTAPQHGHLLRKSTRGRQRASLAPPCAVHEMHERVLHFHDTLGVGVIAVQDAGCRGIAVRQRRRRAIRGAVAAGRIQAQSLLAGDAVGLLSKSHAEPVRHSHLRVRSKSERHGLYTREEVRRQ